MLISYNLVDTRMGRKGVMLIGYSLAAVFSILFYFSHAFWSIMVSIVGLNVCMMIGVGALYTANTESYPTHIKSIGAGFNISMCKVGVILASVVSGGLMTLDWGESAVLISIPVFFGVLCGAVLLQKDTRYLKHFN